jgi:HAD superfamily hydrolase (TIGR01484 family)
MRFAALAADYDGTLARGGAVAPATVDALDRLKATGRKLVLVTGRELDELLALFPAIDRFDRVVAENGALLYVPATGKRRVLAERPPAAFVAELERRRVPLSVGTTIVATVQPHEATVLAAIRDLGLELHVIFNKGAVMVLPASVNKASGLKVALDELGLSPRNVVAIGDAENDHALLRSAEIGVAVANAVPMLQQEADITSARAHGDAVIELVERLLEDDLRAAQPRQARRQVLLGVGERGADVRIPVVRTGLLITGPSGSGKATHASAFVNGTRLEGYQFCVIDPAGDYADLAEAIVFGAAESAPTVAEVLAALEKPESCVVANLCGLPRPERGAFFRDLAPRLEALHRRTGRPHLLLIAEAHQLLGRDSAHAVPSLEAASTVCVTAHADRLASTVLQGLDLTLVLGTAPCEVLAPIAAAIGVEAPLVDGRALAADEGLLWDRRNGIAEQIRLAGAAKGHAK